MRQPALRAPFDLMRRYSASSPPQKPAAQILPDPAQARDSCRFIYPYVAPGEQSPVNHQNQAGPARPDWAARRRYVKKRGGDYDKKLYKIVPGGIDETATTPEEALPVLQKHAAQGGIMICGEDNRDRDVRTREHADAFGWVTRSCKAPKLQAWRPTTRRFLPGDLDLKQTEREELGRRGVDVLRDPAGAFEVCRELWLPPALKNVRIIWQLSSSAGIGEDDCLDPTGRALPFLLLLEEPDPPVGLPRAGPRSTTPASTRRAGTTSSTGGPTVTCTRSIWRTPSLKGAKIRSLAAGGAFRRAPRTTSPSRRCTKPKRRPPLAPVPNAYAV